MYSRGDKEFLLDMFLSCKRILEYTKELSFEDFQKDNKTIDATIRNIEILGEAVKNISKNFQEKYPDIKWNLIARTRDKLIHFYFGIDVPTLWKTIAMDIPVLYAKLKKIIEIENWEDEI